MNLTQCRMARAALRWSLDDLANAAGVGRRTVATYEAGGQVSPESVAKLQAALMAQGVAFTNGGGRVGVSVKRED